MLTDLDISRVDHRLAKLRWILNYGLQQTSNNLTKVHFNRMLLLRLHLDMAAYLCTCEYEADATAQAKKRIEMTEGLIRATQAEESD